MTVSIHPPARFVDVRRGVVQKAARDARQRVCPTLQPSAIIAACGSRWRSWPLFDGTLPRVFHIRLISARTRSSTAVQAGARARLSATDAWHRAAAGDGMTLHFYLRVVESKGAGDVIELQNRPVRFSNPATRLGNRPVPNIRREPRCTQAVPRGWGLPVGGCSGREAHLKPSAFNLCPRAHSGATNLRSGALWGRVRRSRC